MVQQDGMRNGAVAQHVAGKPVVEGDPVEQVREVVAPVGRKVGVRLVPQPLGEAARDVQSEVSIVTWPLR